MIGSRPDYTIAFFVLCEHCGTEGPEAGRIGHAIRRAKRAGWKLIYKKYYCPEHLETWSKSPEEIEADLLESVTQIVEEKK